VCHSRRTVGVVEEQPLGSSVDRIHTTGAAITIYALYIYKEETIIMASLVDQFVVAASNNNVDEMRILVEADVNIDGIHSTWVRTCVILIHEVTY
jgi:hypothetical protein